ncbi:MAG: response regulator [Magnetococcales bacterium]|nr:response regulator [Magnetococcales bacterium]
MSRPIRVLLVDASPLSQALLKRLLAPWPDLVVAGSARDGAEGLRLIEEVRPDLICTDIFMPVMDGLEFTRAVRERSNPPVLVVTDSLREEQPISPFDLLVAGALDLFYKPVNWNAAEAEDASRALAGKIRLLVGLHGYHETWITPPPRIPDMAMPAVNLVVIGGGTGVVPVLREILAGLGADFPVPILCVTHLAPVFHRPLIHWLARQTSMLVQEGSQGEMPMPGSVYFAPPGHHLLVDRQGCLRLSEAAPFSNRRPSLTVTLESVAEHLGGAVIGVLLSGTGQDGVRGLAALHHAEGITLVQDDTTAIAFDLPRQAIDLGVATHVLPCSDMAGALLNLTGKGEMSLVDLPAVAPSGTGRVPRLLIVEDSAIQAFKLRRFLREAGFDPGVAKDGQEGLEMARRDKPELVISDVSMPRMNGFQLCRAIKDDPELQGTRVMLLTALTNPDEILEGLAAGADNYLVKPWEDAALRTMIDQLLAPAPAVAGEQAGELEVTFEERTFRIASSRMQILNLLMTTFQKAVRQNKELVDKQLEMKLLNQQLVETYAKEARLNQQLRQEMGERQRMEVDQSRTLRELEEANRELDDFAFIIAHDLKTPLRGIGSLTSWLVGDYAAQLTEEGADLVRLLARRAERINLLIEALLQYTRVSRVNEELTMVDLGRVVRNVIKGLSVPDEMEILVETPMPMIHFQENRAEQIFHCLLDNAVRHMGKPVGVVRVARIDADEEPHWKFRVSDTGPGIEERYFEKIFAIFQTLQPRDEAENAGMGLALVRKIVEKYAGQVWVESRPGEGSHFFFTLPKELTPMLQVRGRSRARPSG